MEARNDLGVGEPSPRIVFRTANSPRPDREIPKDSYNVTSCCVNAGVMEDCEQAYHHVQNGFTCYLFTLCPEG